MSNTPRMRSSRTGQALTGCKLRERNWRKQKDKKKKQKREKVGDTVMDMRCL